jgi:hypothetical protein
MCRHKHLETHGVIELVIAREKLTASAIAVSRLTARAACLASAKGDIERR